jgi:hypothetical protein
MVADWYWAVRSHEPARDAFVIADGKQALWARVRREVSADERCAWDAVHPGKHEADLVDILRLLLTVVPTYRINHNRFVIEAAQIPAFARYLRNAPEGLANHVSNSLFRNAVIPLEPYSADVARRLGQTVSATLGIEPDWFEL